MNDQTEKRSEGSFSFGAPGRAAEVDRTVEVMALDDLAFDPDRLRVTLGDTIEFVVTNEGRAPHEFVLGDSNYQEEHAQDMSHGGHEMGAARNAIELDPGETMQLGGTFTSAGEVLFACHVEGHYEGGMVGTVVVQG